MDKMPVSYIAATGETLLVTVDDGTGPRFPLSSIPVEPGQVCPTCGEKTPSERALKMREWRARRVST